LTVLQVASQAIVGLLLAAGTAGVVWLAATRALAGYLTAGDVVLLTAYVAMLYKPLETLSYTAAIVQGAAAGGRRVFEILDALPEVREKSEATALVGRAHGHLVFEHVSFAYTPAQPVLRDVSLDIPVGTTVAIVGASGAGKTTLASLLLRFYDPTGGRITLDGRDLRDLTLESLRRNVALVLQEPVLFSATIRENIAYGRPDATIAEIEQAARAAGAHAFVDALPDRYDTKIGERGGALSGGQRQRIAIARAFLKDAPILVMDEPTSALDVETEAYLLTSLAELSRGRTTIVIAHRLSTIRNADQVVVLDAGRKVQEGTHAELATQPGAFRRLREAAVV
jgi:ATP-binding cassette subfamily B protein/subfamily B ATP-binding cassette protein MsbA